ncbi:NAD(P)H dehydrogenase (quinone) [Cryobacterium sp. MP_3.1]|uniref:NAD(P)-dependent oxidoreductase n=1 Tax=Cryobacterium zongtaii TaxID=1259217 RepID=A0A2S3ZN59_9MICO|nr:MULTISPECIES: SDR family oxidoreductase [Cryobacterium]MEC5183308.1 NAD(P)H dehydrogenase (quinone) [Cryobacterium sp. MP_3.1]POH70369.1 NAD(P)-dependent oxidoreductase [Cryobacterium zongtaii]
MSIVVTGATGQLGHLIVEHLINRGVAPAEITAVGRNTARLADLAATGVSTAVIDYTDPASLATAFTGADVLMLVSGSEVGQRVAQHTNAITAAVAAGVGRIVYTSAPKADTSALILAPEHKATEEALVASGVPFTILRNGWYTENYAAAVQQARETGVYLTSTGAGRVASASRNDYAEAAAVVLTTPGHENAVYELAGDIAWTGTDMAAALTEVVGRPVVFTPVSPEEHTAILTGAGLDGGTVGFVVALDGNTRDGLLAGGSSDLATLIGRPTTPLLDGLRAVA